MEKNYFFGIDVSKETLDVALYEKLGKGRQKDVVKVSNDKTGFRELHKWFKQLTKEQSEIVVCLEHTGIYAMGICLWFESKSIDYSLLCPLHLKRSMGLVRGKNDQVDALRIAEYCYLHREQLRYSKLPSGELRMMKNLMNERELLVKELSALKGKDMKPDDHSANTIKRHKRRMDDLKRDIKEVETEMNNLLEACPAIKENYELLTSIPGISFVNATAIIVATENFTRFTDASKYACHIGVAPFPHTSGTSVRGGTRTSFYGNKRLKAIITQAARSAVQHDVDRKSVV